MNRLRITVLEQFTTKDALEADRAVPANSRHRHFGDVDVQAEGVFAAYRQQHCQLGVGPFSGVMSCVELDGVLISRQSINNRIIQSGVCNQSSLLWNWNPKSLYRCNGAELSPERAQLVPRHLLRGRE